MDTVICSSQAEIIRFRFATAQNDNVGRARRYTASGVSSRLAHSPMEAS
jgi:hypothetical protein